MCRILLCPWGEELDDYGAHALLDQVAELGPLNALTYDERTKGGQNPMRVRAYPGHAPAESWVFGCAKLARMLEFTII